MNEFKLATTEKFGDIFTNIYEDEDNEMYMTAKQLGECLGYSNPVRSISNLVNRNDYLQTTNYSVVTKLMSTDGKSYNTRIFTEIGIYEITFLSKTKKAKEFRNWVSNILRQVRKGKITLSTNNATFTPELFEIILQKYLPCIIENKQLHTELNNISHKMERIESLVRTLMPTPRYTDWKNKVSKEIKQLSNELYGSDEFDFTKKIYCNIYKIMRERFDCDISDYQRNYLLLHQDEKSVKPIDIIDMTPELRDIFEAVLNDYPKEEN